MTPFLQNDIKDVKAFCDRCIGMDYFSELELKDLQKRSMTQGLNASFVLRVDKVVIGIRITIPPGQWESGKNTSLSEEKWPHSKKHPFQQASFPLGFFHFLWPCFRGIETF